MLRPNVSQKDGAFFLMAIPKHDGVFLFSLNVHPRGGDYNANADKPNGIHRILDDHGFARFTECWHGFKRNGPTEFFYNGILLHRMEFTDGRRFGRETMYNHVKQVIFEADWVCDSYFGLVTFKDPDDPKKKIATIVYDRDRTFKIVWSDEYEGRKRAAALGWDLQNPGEDKYHREILQCYLKHSIDACKRASSEESSTGSTRSGSPAAALAAAPTTTPTSSRTSSMVSLPPIGATTSDTVLDRARPLLGTVVRKLTRTSSYSSSSGSTISRSAKDDESSVQGSPTVTRRRLTFDKSRDHQDVKEVAQLRKEAEAARVASQRDYFEAVELANERERLIPLLTLNGMAAGAYPSSSSLSPATLARLKPGAIVIADPVMSPRLNSDRSGSDEDEFSKRLRLANERAAEQDKGKSGKKHKKKHGKKEKKGK